MTAYHNRLIDMVYVSETRTARSCHQSDPDGYISTQYFAIVVQALRKLPIRPYSVRTVFVAETEFRAKKSHDEPVNPRHFTALITVTYQVACKISSFRQKRMDFGGPCCRPAAPDVIGATIGIWWAGLSANEIHVTFPFS